MYERGSEWRRWDLHVHTPFSILNNQFGSDFDKYVISLFSKAIEAEIAVIGITDYFSIDGYKKIREKYLGDASKLQVLFPDHELRNYITNILLLPNIELRLNTFVGENAHAANYHVVFSNEVSLDDIERKFLGALNIQLSANGGRPRSVKADRAGITEFGQYIKKAQCITGDDYKVGLENATVSLDDVLSVLHQELCFKDKYLLCFPSDEDWSDVNWDGRDGNTRRYMVQSAHILFASNPNTISWALGKHSESVKAYIDEFLSIRPCMSGCDAHKIEDLFQNSNDRFCWIKANPTFNGLLQTLYEPEQRVRISQIKPECKPEYQVIRSVRIIDDNFASSPILLNDKLICIIGGKSTGKSLLLHNIAFCIDRNQVEEKCSISESKVRPVKELEVTWGDGHVTKLSQSAQTDKIIYIPQTYLNRLSDEVEEKTEVDDLVQDTLLQDAYIKNMYIQQEKSLDIQKKAVDQAIYELISLHKQLIGIKSAHGELGNSDGIGREIERLAEKKASILKELDVSADVIKEYEDISKKTTELTSRSNQLEIDKKFLSSEFIIKLDAPNYDILAMVSHELISSEIATIQSIVDKHVQVFLAPIIDQIDEELEKNRVALSSMNSHLEKIRPLIIKSQGLAEIEQKIKQESEKQQRSLAFENQMNELQTKIDLKLDDIVCSQDRYCVIHKEFSESVNGHSAASIDDMEFHLDTVFRREKFVEYIKRTFDNRTLSRFSICELKSFDVTSYTAPTLKAIAISMMQNDALSLQLKSDCTLENALRELFADWYNINYVVKMEDDLIEEMSPGKKALVLLKLLIGMAESSTPILIDQPEDDLDNRSVFDDLVKYIRKRKLNRQIIIVTHNANIVIGGDAEQVIVANQQGKNSPNLEFKFEYRPGSIEDDNAEVNENGHIKDGILNQKGIQSHICEILEGGRTAFELRRNKYFISQ